MYFKRPSFKRGGPTGIAQLTPRVKAKYGFQGFLVGENFMKTQNPGASAAAFIKEIEDEA